jgi:hypothetical protein
MEPNHPIVDEPWRFCIIRIEYFIGQRPDESYIDLTLQEGISMQKLRFLRPRQVRIDDVFEARIEIVDIRERRWENLNLWITGYADSDAGIEFYAKDVVKVA